MAARIEPAAQGASGNGKTVVLQRSHHTGLFGEAFIRVLAAAAGLTVAKAEPDVTGDDFTLGYPGQLAGVRNPKVDVQVKSRSRRTVDWKHGHWALRLEVAHYNQLAGCDYALPRFLFLVVVPDELPDYVQAGERSTLLRHCAYWICLHDRDRVDPERQKTVSVAVPAANRLSVNSLVQLLERRMPELASR